MQSDNGPISFYITMKTPETERRKKKKKPELVKH